MTALSAFPRPTFPQRGGCFCGAVRYSLSEDPITLYACHCSDCQTQTGSSFLLSMVVRADALETTQGEPERFDLTLPDGRVKRGRFCSRCATRLWGEPERLPGLAVLRPGTLDDTSWVIPIGHIWTASAQSWVPIPEGPISIAGQPEGDETIALARAWKERGN